MWRESILKKRPAGTLLSSIISFCVCLFSVFLWNAFIQSLLAPIIIALESGFEIRIISEVIQRDNQLLRHTQETCQHSTIQIYTDDAKSTYVHALKKICNMSIEEIWYNVLNLQFYPVYLKIETLLESEKQVTLDAYFAKLRNAKLHTEITEYEK